MQRHTDILSATARNGFQHQLGPPSACSRLRTPSAICCTSLSGSLLFHLRDYSHTLPLISHLSHRILTAPLPPPRNLVSQEAKARVKAVGITRLTPVQDQTLRALIVEGRDVLVQAPTGSGKTLAYLLPLAHILAQLDAGARDADAVAAVRSA